DLLRHEAAHFINGAVHFRLLGGVELRIGEQQRPIEVAEEESLGKAERLRSGEEYFFRLSLLLLELCGGQSHVVRSAKRGSQLSSVFGIGRGGTRIGRIRTDQNKKRKQDQDYLCLSYPRRSVRSAFLRVLFSFAARTLTPLASPLRPGWRRGNPLDRC